MKGLALGLNEYWSIPYDIAWKWVLIINFGFDLRNKNNIEKAALDDKALNEEACTAFAFHSVEGTFLSHNTDNIKSSMEPATLLHLVPDNGDNSFFTFFTPGFVGASLAVNSQNLALTYNVGGNNKNPMAGMPGLLKAREVMATCDTVAEAVKSFKSGLEAGGTYGYATTNFLIVDLDNGTMVRIQVCSDEIKVTYGKELKPGVKYIAFTNEFDDDFSPRPAEDLELEKVISSMTRYERLMELLSTYDKYDLKTCWDILNDTSGGEADYYTICRDDGDSHLTTMAHIFTATTSYYTVGPPCQYLAKYDAMSFDSQDPVKSSTTGTVSARGRSLAKAKITLKSLDEQGLELKTYSAIDGTFTFNNLVPGRYRIKASKFFHFPRSITVDFDGQTPVDTNIKLLF